MKTCVFGFALLLSVSTIAVAQQAGFPSGPIDIGALRRQVMARHFDATEPADLYEPEAFPVEEAAPPAYEVVWGMRVAPVPELIYLHCPKLKQDAGLLIEAVHPGGPAEKAGLAPGEIIAGTEQQWIYSPEELPELAAPQALIVLQAGKLCKVVVEPLIADEQAEEATAGAAAEPAESTCGACQAISMACVNGRYQIEAAYATPQGTCKVQLNGTRAEIEKSLAPLPPAVKQAIENRLDMASP